MPASASAPMPVNATATAMRTLGIPCLLETGWGDTATLARIAGPAGRNRAASLVSAPVIRWLPSLLLLYAQLGYLALLAAWARAERPPALDEPPAPTGDALPGVSLIVAAHDEEAVIAAKVANALALDYPRELLEVVV